MRQYFARGVLSVALVLSAVTVWGTEQEEAAPHASASAAPSRQPAPAITQHVMTLGGEKLAYTATAGYMPLTDEAGKLQANIFYVAYVREGVEGASSRPLTFAFNGGPGASSMWLHLGVGPKHVVLAADGTALPASTALANNAATWLGFTDLVFVDPIGTGYSRAADGVDARQFYEVARDIQVAAGFVRRYVTQYQRWLSPKFILGESYGTTRAAGVVNRLQDAAGIDVNGVILLSCALDFATFSFDPANDLPYALALPSYAATAWYHKKLQGSLQADLTETLRRAENWALNEYLIELAKGDALSDTERDQVAQQLAEFTGIAQSELVRGRLRMGPLRFGKRLLRDEHRILGRLDGRVTSADVAPGSDYTESDPAFFLVTGPLVAALNDYLQRDLQYRTDVRYEFLSKEANHSWKWLAGGQGYVYVADELAEAMARDHRLHVFAGAGYFDLATPYLAQRYTFDHMGLERSLRDHMTFKSYPTGHQIYTDPASAQKLKDDVEAFVKCAASVREC